MGKGFQYTDADSFNLTYTTRTGVGSTPKGTEIGIKIKDDGCWYYDVERNKWELIGGLNLDDAALKNLIENVVKTEISITSSHIILDHLPSQYEINAFPVNSVVLVYNPNEPYVPHS